MEYKYTSKHFNENHSRIIMEIVMAVLKQNEKRGNPDYPPGTWLSLLGEEFGEVCQALQFDEEWSKDTDKDNLYEELIDVATVCIRWAASIKPE